MSYAISVGDAPLGYNGNWTGGQTRLSSAPANGSGKLLQAQVLPGPSYDLTGVKIGVFYVVSGNNLTCRGWQVVPNLTHNVVNTVPLNLDVVTGDYIGIIFNYNSGNGYIRRSDNSPGSACYYYIGDAMGCVNLFFNIAGSYKQALQGFGNPAKMSRRELLVAGVI